MARVPLPPCPHAATDVRGREIRLLSGNRICECPNVQMTEPEAGVGIESCGGCRYRHDAPRAGGTIRTVPAKPRVPKGMTPARVQRCRQLKAAGLPCPDDPGSQPAAAPAPPAAVPPASEEPMNWAYGVTTVPERRGDLLPRTLASLAAGGFDRPTLFVDGDKDIAGWEREFGLPTTVRGERIRPYGNWILAAWELFVRNPAADRYAIFQDDLACVRNLRAYLERLPYPRAGYWNLYTHPENEGLCPRAGPIVMAAGGNHLVNKGERLRGFYPSNGQGLGAVALVLDRDAMRALLTHQEPAAAEPGAPRVCAADAKAGDSAAHMVDRTMNAGMPSRYSCIDGGVVDALRKSNRRELVHYPTLVAHTGARSTIAPEHRYRAPVSFPGEAFDALELLGMTTIAGTRV